MKTKTEGLIALLNIDDVTYERLKDSTLSKFNFMRFNNLIELFKYFDHYEERFVAIISQSEVMGIMGANVVNTLIKRDVYHIPFFLLVERLNDNLVKICMHAGVADVFALPLAADTVERRIGFMIDHWGGLHKRLDTEVRRSTKRIRLAKRIFDIFFASLALVCLAPLLLLVMIIMKLESKGPIFYYSLRVGTGYKVFKFYKFRSMYVNADQRLKDLMHLNQYNNDNTASEEPANSNLCGQCVLTGEKKCRNALYADKHVWCEKQYNDIKKRKQGAAFFKLKNDPRITKVGNILRNTSIDELPQLWNVIMGDMSIVGNRPLPLYEAEKLTTDKHALRFLAPAGLTGLWQVEKRGKGKMSEEERLMLDNAYAEQNNFLFDIKLILRTVPALFQKESV